MSDSNGAADEAAGEDARPETRAILDVIDGGFDPIRRLGTAVELLRQAADLRLHIHLYLFENGERRLEVGARLRDLTPELLQQLRGYEREIATIIDVTKHYHCSMQEGRPSPKTRPTDIRPPTPPRPWRHGGCDDDLDDFPF
jgi:hypothetical protein